MISFGNVMRFEREDHIWGSQWSSSFIIHWSGLWNVSTIHLSAPIYFMVSHEHENIACWHYSITDTSASTWLSIKGPGSGHGTSRAQLKKKTFKCSSIALVTLTWHSACFARVWFLSTDQRPRPWSLRPPPAVAVCSLSTWPSPGFTWHLKTSSRLLFPTPTSQAAHSETERKWYQKQEV